MNRRSFFNFLGSAVIGTVIALKLPDSIAPIKILVEKTKITFAALDEAYRKCCIEDKEPNLILVSVNTFREVHKLLGPIPYADENGFLLFHGAKIQSDRIGLNGKLIDIFNFGQLEDDEIQVSGNYYGNLGRFNF